VAWLQKRPQVSDPAMFYTVGLNKTLLIVGLGNIGKEYENTRHNLGFICLDEFVKKNEDMSPWVNKKDLSCQESIGRLGDSKVIAIKPTTLMNNSGQAVMKTSRFYNIAPVHILVLHDELDVNFGKIRLSTGGSDAGHNGIKSVSQAIGEDYARIRIGIGPKEPENIPSEKFVLARFSEKESKQLDNLKKESLAAISEFIYSGSLPSDTRSFIV